MKQKVYFGPGALKHIKEIFAELSAQKIFVVAGKKSFIESGAQSSLKPFLKNLKVVYFHDFSSNPEFEQILRGVKKIDDDVSAVLAVGGGSPLDVAKAINILAAQDGEPLEYVRGKRHFIGKGKPLIAVPTTSGSGSESTQFSIFYIDGAKHAFEHESLIPDYAVVDPKLTMSMPKQVAASTGMDAFSQAVESYWSIYSTEESRGYAREAIRVILSALKESVNNPNLKARSEMSNAACLAGRAINITRTTVCHALAYTITKEYGIPHGHAVALTLGQALEYNAGVTKEDCNDSRGPLFVRNQIQELLFLLGVKTPVKASALIHRLMQEIGLETEWAPLGLNEKAIANIIAKVNVARLKNNPRAFKNSKHLMSLFLPFSQGS